MAKITVDLEAFYGYGCGFQGYGSDDTIEIEVSDKELEALKGFGKDEITAEDVVEAIEGGDCTLESLHEQLSEKFYYMVEEYWLYEADNECLYDSLAEHMSQDISDGLYKPKASGDDEDCDDEDYDEDELECDDDLEEDDNEEYDCDDDDEYYDDDDEAERERHDLDAYFDWVQEHDHEFAAERVGLDLDACRDDEVCYTIRIDD